MNYYKKLFNMCIKEFIFNLEFEDIIYIITFKDGTRDNFIKTTYGLYEDDNGNLVFSPYNTYESISIVNGRRDTLNMIFVEFLQKVHKVEVAHDWLYCCETEHDVDDIIDRFELENQTIYKDYDEYNSSSTSSKDQIHKIANIIDTYKQMMTDGDYKTLMESLQSIF